MGLLSTGLFGLSGPSWAKFYRQPVCNSLRSVERIGCVVDPQSRRPIKVFLERASAFSSGSGVSCWLVFSVTQRGSSTFFWLPNIWRRRHLNIKQIDYLRGSPMLRWGWLSLELA